jgi:hypothetical protein
MKSKNASPAALLNVENEQTVHVIKIKLQSQQWAEMKFSDKNTAREYFEFLRTYGVISGSAIREIVLEQQK